MTPAPSVGYGCAFVGGVLLGGLSIGLAFIWPWIKEWVMPYRRKP